VSLRTMNAMVSSPAKPIPLLEDEVDTFLLTFHSVP
jgi:hypothetical protein